MSSNPNFLLAKGQYNLEKLSLLGPATQIAAVTGGVYGATAPGKKGKPRTIGQRIGGAVAGAALGAGAGAATEAIAGKIPLKIFKSDDDTMEKLSTPNEIAYNGALNARKRVVNRRAHLKAAGGAVGGAEGAADAGLVGDLILRFAGREGAGGDHGGLQRVDVAGHDGVERDDEVGDALHRVGGEMRHGGVAGFALHCDGEITGGGHHGAVMDHDGAGFQARPVMVAEHALAGELLEQAVLHHGGGAAETFLGRLEDQVDRAGPAGIIQQEFGRTKEGGGVAVMAAGVHLAGVPAGVWQVGRLQDRQRVHVGAQADGAVGGTAGDAPHHAVAADAGVTFDAHGGQLLTDESGGGAFVK